MTPPPKSTSKGRGAQWQTTLIDCSKKLKIVRAPRVFSELLRSSGTTVGTPVVGVSCSSTPPVSQDTQLPSAYDYEQLCKRFAKQFPPLATSGQPKTTPSLGGSSSHTGDTNKTAAATKPATLKEETTTMASVQTKALSSSTDYSGTTTSTMASSQQSTNIRVPEWTTTSSRPCATGAGTRQLHDSATTTTSTASHRAALQASLCTSSAVTVAENNVEVKKSCRTPSRVASTTFAGSRRTSERGDGAANRVRDDDLSDRLVYCKGKFYLLSTTDTSTAPQSSERTEVSIEYVAAWLMRPPSHLKVPRSIHHRYAHYIRVPAIKEMGKMSVFGKPCTSYSLRLEDYVFMVHLICRRAASLQKPLSVAVLRRLLTQTLQPRNIPHSYSGAAIERQENLGIFDVSHQHRGCYTSQRERTAGNDQFNPSLSSREDVHISTSLLSIPHQGLSFDQLVATANSTSALINHDAPLAQQRSSSVAATLRGTHSSSLDYGAGDCRADLLLDHDSGSFQGGPAQLLYRSSEVPCAVALTAMSSSSIIDYQKMMGPYITDEVFLYLIHLFETLSGSRDLIPLETAISEARRHLGLLSGTPRVLRDVYTYWKTQRMTLGKPLLRELWPVPSASDNSPYAIFRARTKEKMVLRRPRRHGVDSNSRLEKLALEFSIAESLFAACYARDLLKLKLCDLDACLYEQLWKEKDDPKYVHPLWESMKRGTLFSQASATGCRLECPLTAAVQRLGRHTTNDELESPSSLPTHEKPPLRNYIPCQPEESFSDELCKKTEFRCSRDSIRPPRFLKRRRVGSVASSSGSHLTVNPGADSSGEISTVQHSASTHRHAADNTDASLSTFDFKRTPRELRTTPVCEAEKFFRPPSILARRWQPRRKTLDQAVSRSQNSPVLRRSDEPSSQQQSGETTAARISTETAPVEVPSPSAATSVPFDRLLESDAPHTLSGARAPSPPEQCSAPGISEEASSCLCVSPVPLPPVYLQLPLNFPKEKLYAALEMAWVSAEDARRPPIAYIYNCTASDPSVNTATDPVPKCGGTSSGPRIRLHSRATANALGSAPPPSDSVDAVTPLSSAQCDIKVQQCPPQQDVPGSSTFEATPHASSLPAVGPTVPTMLPVYRQTLDSLPKAIRHEANRRIVIPYRVPPTIPRTYVTDTSDPPLPNDHTLLPPPSWKSGLPFVSLRANIRIGRGGRRRAWLDRHRYVSPTPGILVADPLPSDPSQFPFPPVTDSTETFLAPYLQSHARRLKAALQNPDSAEGPQGDAVKTIVSMLTQRTTTTQDSDSQDRPPLSALTTVGLVVQNDRSLLLPPTPQGFATDPVVLGPRTDTSQGDTTRHIQFSSQETLVPLIVQPQRNSLVRASSHLTFPASSTSSTNAAAPASCFGLYSSGFYSTGLGGPESTLTGTRRSDTEPPFASALGVDVPSASGGFDLFCIPRHRALRVRRWDATLSRSILSDHHPSLLSAATPPVVVVGGGTGAGSVSAAASGVSLVNR